MGAMSTKSAVLIVHCEACQELHASLLVVIVTVNPGPFVSFTLPPGLSIAFGKQCCLLPWPTVLLRSEPCFSSSLMLSCSSLPIPRSSFFLCLEQAPLVPTGGRCTRYSSLHLDSSSLGCRPGRLLPLVWAVGHTPAPQTSFMTTFPIRSGRVSSTVCPHFFSAVT